MTGTEWDVWDVVSVTDGDTVRLIRSRQAQLGDDWFRLTDITSKPVRLVWVNTPERGQPGYQEATSDLESWIRKHAYDDNGDITLRVVCYDGGAGWDRLLGDLIDEHGQSASQWLMVERGWPPYVGGAA